MPNTINPAVLARRYAEKYGEPCNLSHAKINELWSLTRTSTGRGRNVDRGSLEHRATTCLDSMRQMSMRAVLKDE